MAKVGEGDSRWIVAERKDGQNVNAWHWQESSLNEKAHDALKKIFTDFAFTDNVPEGLSAVQIKEISDIDGDVTVAQRKGKIMCYFELKMTMKYAAKMGDDELGGKVSIPDVDHDTFRESDYTMTVAAAERGAGQQKAEDYVRVHGRKAIRKAIADYFEALFIEYNVGKNIKGPGSPTGPGPAAATATGTASPTSPPPAPKPASPKPAATSSSDATSFEQVLIWRVPREEIWTLLTDAPRASAYTRGPAKIDPRPSGAFEFLGGAMTGYYVDVEHPKKLSMQWRLSSWPSGVFSSVVINLTPEEAGVCRMEFAQVGIPAGEMERCKGGWMCNFWEPIKALFGFSFTIQS